MQSNDDAIGLSATGTVHINSEFLINALFAS
jgi:hypothetical protein